jgi:hypothetical protein
MEEGVETEEEEEGGEEREDGEIGPLDGRKSRGGGDESKRAWSSG